MNSTLVYHIQTTGWCVSVSEEECKQYSDSKGAQWGGSVSSGSVSGCSHLDPSRLNFVFYNADWSSTETCSNGEQCVCLPPGKTIFTVL